MALTKFLLVRPDGQVEGSKAYDKIDTRALSFFAAIPNDPVTTGLTILGGSAYIQKSYVTVADTLINMGIGGNYQTTAIPANNYCVMYFSVDSTGTIVATQGTPSVTPGGVGQPNFPIGNAPICKVNFRDNGSGGAGTILTISLADITDARPFFYSNFQKPNFGTDAITDLKVLPTFPSTTGVSIEPGAFFFTSGQYVTFAGSTIDMGTGGDHQAPTLPPNYYNKVLVVLTIFNTIATYFGTPSASANTALLPVTPPDAMPLAIVTIQDNGLGQSGSLKPIQLADVVDARSFLGSFLGQIRTTYLDYCRVVQNNPADKRVLINPGVIYPLAGVLINFPATQVDFGTGTYQTAALPAGYYQRVLITVNVAGQLLLFYSTPAATQGALVNPAIPKSVIPLCFIDVQDDGSSAPGSIRPIQQSYITDIRPWLGQSPGSSGNLTIVQNTYSDYLLNSTWMQGHFEDFTGLDFIDSPNTTGTVDTLVNYNVTLAPGQVITTTNLYDSYFALSTILDTMVIVDADDTSSNLKIEVTNDGTNWFQTTNLGVFSFTANGLILKARFTNVGASTITIVSYGVYYNDDQISPSFIFSNERQPLYQIIKGNNPLVSGNTITLDDSRSYPLGENTLLVFKNGDLQTLDPTLTLSASYREASPTTIQVNPAPLATDTYILIIPAGYFGQSVASFESSLNALIPAQHIFDQIVRFPTEGTATTVQQGLGYIPGTIGGNLLLESQTFTSTTVVTTSGAPVRMVGKTHTATMSVAGGYNGSIFTVLDNYEVEAESFTISATSYSANATGLTLQGISSDVYLKNIVFQNLGIGINVTGNSYRLILENCKFINCGQAVLGADNVIAINCIVDGSANGVNGIKVGANSRVTGCKFSNTTTNAIQITGSGSSATDNVMTNFGFGVVLSSAAIHCVVSNNRIVSGLSPSTGVQVDGNGNAIQSNTIYGTYTGLLINGSENVVGGNVITDSAIDGINLSATATNNEIGTNVLARNPT